MRGQILIDQGEQNNPRRRLYFGNSLVELPLAAHEGINMLNRRHPFVLRRDGAAGGNQGFARRVGNQMQMKVMPPQEISRLAMVSPNSRECREERGITAAAAAWQPFPLDITKEIHPPPSKAGQ